MASALETAFDPHALAGHVDSLTLPSGRKLMLRFAQPDDSDRLQRYFRSLSQASRHNRLMSGAPELPAPQLDRFVHSGEADAYTLIASMADDDSDDVIGEVRYGHFGPDVEFGLSVADRWRGQGIGSVMLANLECRAAALGGERLFGDTLRSNSAMISLARSSGYQFSPTPYDWKQVRLEKPVTYLPLDIPCTTWRLAAGARRSIGV
ncbi:GNAT family N-acetyltransferase [Rhodopseudomonas sp. B29]|uniref:GNAT family N-acetyltransferase n=1 Tax=Rhodopseudomonas sp. B29 TaxID=95607 RepID=UPI00034BD050|nr:GNAT family N-acetyltransferase [Rhodopseudomonas sp. B29]